MSDKELDRLEKEALPIGSTLFAIDRVKFLALTAEVRRLRQQIEGHCARIAAQSELLSKRSEK